MGRVSKKSRTRLEKEIMTELAAIGLTRATDVLLIENGQIGIRAPSQMEPEHAAAIASVEKTTGGYKIKFYDKLKALELLGSHMGLFGGGGTRRQEEENNLLEAIIAATQEEMVTSDIQELQQTADPCHDLVEPTRS